MPAMLVIDDDDTIALNAPHFLRGERLRIDVVRDIEQAAQSLCMREYDVVLLDVALTGAPIAAGIDLIEIARRSQPRSKLVVLSAFGSNDIVAEAAQRGADRFLHKPLSFGAIDAELRSIFARQA
jgi:DNA-binding response OmpR family regulator